MTNGFVHVLAPSFAARIFGVIPIPVFVGEASFCVWLLVKGVNLDKWKAHQVLDA